MTSSNGDDNVIQMSEKSDGRGQFFTVDRRAWAHVCSLGINAAVAYLVLASGTGGDNRTTSWSVNAIETYTGIGRPRAKAAVQALENHGFIKVLKGGAKPRYYLQPAHLVPGTECFTAPFTRDEQAILEKIAGAASTWVPKVGRHDNGWPVGNPHKIALGLARRGVVINRGGQNFEIGSLAPAEEPDWIWLPNAIVTGVNGETPPVERVRQTQNIAALRIFGDLYYAQNLIDGGGIDWRRPNGLMGSFKRLRVAESGPFVIWGFVPSGSSVYPHGALALPHRDDKQETPLQPFWDAWGLLQKTGVVEVVAHLVEGEKPESEIIHPIARGNGEPLEQRIWASAYAAAKAMSTPRQMEWATVENGATIFAPVQAHLAEVQCIGIVRMKYRPKTSATAIWYASADEWVSWAKRYDDMASDAAAARQPNQAAG